MPTSYTSLLGLALPVTGELSGTWGDEVNNYITQYLDASVAGTQTISGSQTAVTLSKTTNASLSQAGSGATGSSQYLIINCTGNPGSLLTITAPAASKPYIVINATSTNQSVKIVGAGPTTGVTIPAGQRALVAWNGSDFVQVGATPDVTAAGNNTFTGANTFRTTSGTRFEEAATQDAVIIDGRAGGTSSYAVTIRPTTLSASRTMTLPDADTTIPVATQVLTFSGPSAARTYTLPDSNSTLAALATAQTFTAAQTFRAANAIRSEAASTQDAVVIAGRAGGTGSFAVTLTPATLSSNTTLTLPNVTDTVATIGTAQTFTAAQTFRAANAIRSEAASTQDAVVIAGRAGGTSSYAATLTPATLSANRTVTIPDETFTIGFRNLPAVGTKTGSYTLAVADVGKYVQVGSGGSITIPDATFAEGDAVSIFNNTTGNITITCSITTAYIAGTDTDKATMTLATRGVATILFISSTVCVVSGNVS